MLLGVVLLYVGAVLVVNGIWLVGQARAAAAVPNPAATREAATVSGPAVARAEASPLFIQNREIAVLNIFTGFIGVVAAVTLLVQGSAAESGHAEHLPVRAEGVRVTGGGDTEHGQQ